jgi:acyl-coenzyme A synthetase/AMP-(fatty) acid ligase
VIGVPDEVRGEEIVAFVVLNAPAVPRELSDQIVKALGPVFRPRASALGE